MGEPILIQSAASISPLGLGRSAVLSAYRRSASKIVQMGSHLAAPLGEIEEVVIQGLISENSSYAELDRCVLLGLAAARETLKSADGRDPSSIVINFGSSRGATGILEQALETYLTSSAPIPAKTSPTTTLGNISSWIAQELGASMSFSHSATCSTSFGAILNGMAWLRSDMCESFLAGGAEAPLTDFTFAQMDAMRITADTGGEFPCRPLEGKRNTMALGEGACSFLLSRQGAGIGKILGAGWGCESLSSASSISESGEAFFYAMRRAIEDAGGVRPDILVLHAPGTRKGDAAELSAIRRIFGSELPFLVSNKWLIGHTLGASAALSLELALLLLNDSLELQFPYPVQMQGTLPSECQSIMINSSGFGGQAISLLVSGKNDSHL